MSKSTSILIGSIAVLLAGVALVAIGLLADRAEVWQLGALILLGGAGALGVKSKLGGKVAKLVLLAAALALAGCSVGWNDKGFYARCFADDVRIRMPGLEVDAKDFPTRAAPSTTRPAH